MYCLHLSSTVARIPDPSGACCTMQIHVCGGGFASMAVALTCLLSSLDHHLHFLLHPHGERKRSLEGNL